MDDKKAREAAISAKIASIRAANEALEKRHAEVLADKHLAEKKKMAVETRIDSSSRHEERGPLPSVHSKFNRQPVADRAPAKSGGSAQDRLQRDDPPLSVKSRLGTILNAPPPDPSYNFLADRSREESDPEYDQDQNEGARSSQKQRPKGKNQRHKPLNEEKKRTYQHETDRSSQPRRNISALDKGDSEPRSPLPRDSMAPSGFAQSNVEMIVKPFSQLQSRTAPLRQPKKLKCTEAGCNSFNPEKVDLCSNCSHDKNSPVKDAVREISKDTQAKDPYENSASRNEFGGMCRNEVQQAAELTNISNPTPSNSWQPMPVVHDMAMNNWQTKQYQQGHQQEEQWSLQQDQQMEQPFVIGTWGQPSEPQGPRQQWAAQETFQAWPSDGGITWVQHPSYPRIPPVTIVANNIVTRSPPSFQSSQYSEVLTEHGGDMAQLAGMPAQAYISNAQTARQQFYNGQSSRPFRSNGNHPWDTSMRKPSSFGSSSSSNWRDSRDREVTRIPLKFQKQRMPVARHQQCLQSSSLPCAQTSTAPASATRLTVLASDVILSNLNESDLSDSLSLPVRTMEASSFKDFQDKLGKIDPDLDRYVLIHGLSCEVKKIATQDGKSDIQKGAESDQISLDFSEIVEDLSNRIPYLKIFISTLLPRFDNEDKLTMSCPNVVRKVMNVELTSRLAETKNVIFLNNDPVLEWMKDDVKKHRLFSSDGERLTAYGFSIMLDNWMKTFKEEIGKFTNGSPEEESRPPLLSDNESAPESPHQELDLPHLRQPSVQIKLLDQPSDTKQSLEDVKNVLATEECHPPTGQPSDNLHDLVQDLGSHCENLEVSTSLNELEEATIETREKEFQEKDNYEAMEKDAQKVE